MSLIGKIYSQLVEEGGPYKHIYHEENKSILSSSEFSNNKIEIINENGTLKIIKENNKVSYIKNNNHIITNILDELD